MPSFPQVCCMVTLIYSLHFLNLFPKKEAEHKINKVKVKLISLIVLLFVPQIFYIMVILLLRTYVYYYCEKLIWWHPYEGSIQKIISNTTYFVVSCVSTRLQNGKGVKQVLSMCSNKLQAVKMSFELTLNHVEVTSFTPAQWVTEALIHLDGNMRITSVAAVGYIM